MRWYTIDEKFLNYMRDIEPRIPETDYGEYSLKPFFGILFEIGELVYVTQVSHPRSKHKRIKENKDFSKLYNGNQLIGVVNLNYMFPIKKDKLIHIEYRNIGDFRKFETKEQRNKYITLLKREMREIKAKEIDKKAFELYIHKYAFPNDIVSKRCFEFKELEQKCREYIE